MNDQFTRILIPREEPKSTLSQESLNSFMKQVKRGIDILEESMKSLQDQFFKEFHFCQIFSNISRFFRNN
jgi:hypothetical protein